LRRILSSRRAPFRPLDKLGKEPELPTAGCRHGSLAPALLAALCAGVAAPAFADDNPVILEWFETRWRTIEYRMPDFYVAGYDSTWLPSPGLAADPSSPGYDPFDRFNLGTPAAPTLYGTEADFAQLVREFHRAAGLVYVESIMNHNSTRTSDQGFIAAGGWPGFALGLPGDFWGDFHNAGQQSENPGGPNYNLWDGDLVGLIDIDQAETHFYIRQPIEASPQNIPPGTIRNRPDPANRRFYPDTALPPMQFTNPANGQAWTIYPFNTADPMAGDPVADNATGMLMRWNQWMLDVFHVDGFRLDAAKHIPQWFWNNLWDSAVYHRRVTPGGSVVTPYSFVEVVDSNGFMQTYTRKDGFGFRDALDLNGAGQLRDLRASSGFGSWQNVLNSHFDTNDDGQNNGSQGVLHVYSHDNGSTGNGSSQPPLPGPDLYALPQHAYILMRPGAAVVYHNGREAGELFPQRGFWPREGNPTALGNPDQDLVNLVRISNGYARGEFNILNPGAVSDVLVFERRNRDGDGNYIASVLVGVNDRYDNGVQTRTLTTSFAPGTRLHELTGNADDPVVDASGQIPDLLVVNSSRQVTVAVPNNRNTAGVAHHKGYVIYGPAAPTGTLQLSPLASTIPADGPEVDAPRRRTTAMDVVTADTMNIALQTSKTDPADPDWDDNAVFRVNQGFLDSNGNGAVDIPEGGVVGGYEQFLTVRQPLFGTANDHGLYIQTIDTTSLDEGVNYLSVVAFRHRADGGTPIYTEFRRAFYVDRRPPAIQAVAPAGPIGAPSFDLRVLALDRTVDRVHVIVNVPVGDDPRAYVNASNAAQWYDRFEFRRTLQLAPGAYRISVVAYELSGNSTVQTIENVVVSIGSGDVNGDGVVTIDDLFDAYELTAYSPALDLNANGTNEPLDFRLLEARIRASEVPEMGEPQR
jgi:alpha-amylase